MRHVPLQFIETFRRLTWFELLVGVREDWLSLADAIGYARTEADRGNQDALVLRLAGLAPEERAQGLQVLRELSQAEGGEDEQDARLVWMRILLAWTYQNRSQLDDPLSVVEKLYADFGYPVEMRDLIRFNVSEGEYRSESHRRGDNTQLLFERWKSYLDNVFPEDGASTPNGER